MKFTVIASQRSGHQLTHQVAMADGLRKLGIEPVLSYGPCSTEYVACWGWRHGKVLRDSGRQVLVMERGYIGDRFHWTSLAWNGLNGYGEFATAGKEKDASRFNKMGMISPWKDGGEYVLIMGQVPNDASLRGRNMVPWYEANAVLAKDAYGLPVRFRQHPVAIKKGFKQRPRHTEICTAKTLEESMAGAAVVITYNSNSGVDAVLAGIPTITMDKGSMAYEVTGHQPGEKIKVCRKNWANKLSYCQWSIDEISNGVGLKDMLLMKGLI